MIVLDTNVVSEAMKPEPHPAVLAWLNEQAVETLYLSGMTLAPDQIIVTTGIHPSIDLAVRRRQKPAAGYDKKAGTAGLKKTVRHRNRSII